jgi:SAM-dependent methyltransferase
VRGRAESSEGSDVNFERYTTPSVVGHYAGARGLHGSEAYLFDRWIPDNARLLDIGVGGGRTTEPLSARTDYVGIDYSPAMVEATRQRCPGADIRLANAAELSAFESARFDVVVFSFNGIDYLTSEQRRRCVAEVSRVLAPGGMFIFSSHNARVLGIYPQLSGAGLRSAVQIARAIARSPNRALQTFRSGAYSRGEGYFLDPTHGGLMTYVSTPPAWEPQLLAANVHIIEVVGAHHPSRSPAVVSSWLYYACRRALGRV